MDALAMPELSQFVRLLLALFIVLGLMGGLALLLKKLGLAAQTSSVRSAKRRLRIVESLPLDARRRVVLLECDEMQHLVILGANDETLIKADIPAPPVDESTKAHEVT
ncbi:MAG: flagellar biosynthetic protein FliO [Alphaproteobacteria bacterium]